MDSRKILYNKTGDDESYTLPYAVEPILKYIPEGWVVWCPFDTAESEFARQISRTNNVIRSHISEGKVFFTYEPEERWDCIVSNPSFQRKKEFFERALSFGKPFALIMTLTWLNDSSSKKVFMNAGRDMQLLMFDKRMKFLHNGVIENKITFSSAYYCCDFLPRQITLKELNIPKEKK